MKLLVKLVAALAAAVVTATASAAEFKPLLGETLRYASVSTRGKGDDTQRVSSNDELVFEREASGYRLTWRSRDVKVEAKEAQRQLLQQIMDVAAQAPVIYRVSDAGQLEGVENLEHWRALQSRLWDMLLAKMSDLPEHAASRASILAVKAAQERQTDDQLSLQLMESPALLLAGYAAKLEPGGREEEDVDIPLILAPGTMKGHLIRERLADTPEGQGHLRFDIAPEKQDLIRVTRAFFDSMLARLPSDKRAEAIKAIPTDDEIAMRETFDIVYDLRSGLPDHVRHTKEYWLGARGQGAEIVEMTRIR